MLAFALVAYEPDFLMQFFYQGQLVTSVQLLQGLDWREASVRHSPSFSRHGPRREIKTGHKRANIAAE